MKSQLLLFILVWLSLLSCNKSKGEFHAVRYRFEGNMDTIMVNNAGQPIVLLSHAIEGVIDTTFTQNTKGRVHIYAHGSGCMFDTCGYYDHFKVQVFVDGQEKQNLKSTPWIQGKGFDVKFEGSL